MQDNPLKDLYNEFNPTLKLANTYEEFESAMKNESSRKDFFDSFNSELGLAKDFNQFEEVLGLKKKALAFGSELPFGKTALNAPAPSIKNTSQSKLPSTSIPSIAQATEKAAREIAPETMDVPADAVPAITAIPVPKAERQAEKDLELKKQMVYNDMRFARTLDKQQSQERGYDNVKDYYKDRETFLINNFLTDDDKEEARAQNAFAEAKKSGNEKLAGEELQNLLNAKSRFRKSINEQKAEVDNEESELKQSLESGMPKEQFDGAMKVLNQKRAVIETMSKPYYDPNAQMKDFLQGNITEVAAVAKPSQTPKEKLEEYTNALYTQLNLMRDDLGWDADNGAFSTYAKDWQLRREGKGELVDKMYETELKLRNAVKILELNRTPLENETGLGVFGKSFATSLNPASASKMNTAQVVAQNLQSINEDAGISQAVDAEQKKFAEENAKEYKPYSVKWFAQPAGSSAAIALEFIPASMATEGIFAVTKLGRLINIAEQYGKVKGLNTTAKYLKAVNKYKTTKAGDSFAKGIVKIQANGLKFGSTSEMVAQLFPKDADEVNFVSGWTGGQIGKGAELILGGAALSLFKTFGNQAPQAAKAIERLGEQMKFVKDAPKTIVGEIGEEFGESLGNIYSESSNWKEIKAKLDEQFGTLDKATQFVIQTGIMALGMGGGTAVGSGLMKSAKSAYNGLNREQRAIVDEVLDGMSEEESNIVEEITKEVAKEVKAEAPQAVKQINEITNEVQQPNQLPTTNVGQQLEPTATEQTDIGDIAGAGNELAGSDIGVQEPTVKPTNEGNIEQPTGIIDETQKTESVPTEQQAEGVSVPNEPTSLQTNKKEKIEQTPPALRDVEELNNKSWFHGSENEFDEFENKNPNITGFWFSDDKENAMTYGDKVKEARLDIKNPLIIDANGKKFTDDIEVEVLAKYPNEEPYITKIGLPLDEIVWMAKNGKRKNSFIELVNSGYDAVVFKNIIDPALSSRRKIPQTSIAVLDKKQIKNNKDEKTKPKKKKGSALKRLEPQTAEDFIALKLNGLRIKTKSFVDKVGAAYLTPQLRLTYLNNERGTSVNQIANDLKNEGGIFDTMEESDIEEMITQFMIDNPAGSRQYANNREQNGTAEQKRYDEEAAYYEALEKQLEQQKRQAFEDEVGASWEEIESRIDDMSDEDFEKIQNQIIEDEEANKGGSENIPQKEKSKGDISKAERKAISEAKIDEVADKAKEFLNKYLAAKGIDNIKLSGIGQNKVVDILANMVKTLVNAGIEINEAIKEVRTFFESEYDTSEISDFDIKMTIAKDDLKADLEKAGISYRQAVFTVSKYLREVGAEDVITKEDLEQALKNKNEGIKREDYNAEKDALVEFENEPFIPAPPTEEDIAKAKEVAKATEDAFSGSTEKAAKAIVEAIKRAEGYDDATKDALALRIGEFYTTQSHSELQKIAQKAIELLGGTEKAFAEMITNGNIPQNIKIAVLGEVLIEYKKKQDSATTEVEKKKWADKQGDVYEFLDPLIRAAGRGISYMQKIYAASPLAMVRKLKKDLEERNKLNKPDANKKAADIKEIIENQEDVQEAINKAVSEALGETNQTIVSLQKEIEELRKRIGKAPKGSSKNPVKLGITRDTFQQASKRLFSKTYSNPFLNPEFWEDMSIVAGYGLQQGFVKIGEFYKYISKELKGKYKEAYGEVYRRAKADAIAQGAKESEFSSEEEIENEIDEIEKASDAEKLVRLTALKAKVQAKKEANSAKIVADRIIADAKNNLSNETTLKEKDALEKVIAAIVKKAKEKTTPKDKVNPLSTSALITFAFNEQQRANEIYDAAQKQVFEKIDNDKELTDEQKVELKAFLDNYKKSVFDILLTQGQKDKIIREKLIEQGFAKQVNGKIVLNILPLVSSEKTAKKAIDKIVAKVAAETGLSESDLQQFKDAITIRVKQLVAEKKLSELKKYLKQKERYSAARLVGNARRKTSVEKLLDLYNAGGLTNEKVKQELANDLGIEAFTEAEETYLEEQFAKINEAPIGAEKEKLEEEVQAFLELKNKSLFGNAMQDRLRARLLSSPLTSVKNLSGVYEVPIMLIEKLLKTNKHLINPIKWKQGFDLNTFKVLLKSRSMAVNTAMDILVNAGVDLGTAFSETTMTKEGTPRVRYIEYDKKRILPDLYVSLGGKKVNLNIYNVALNNEKIVGRFLAFVDTFSSIALGELKAYSYAKNKYMRENPNLTEREASQQAYDDLFKQDISKAKAEVLKEFKDRGITLDLIKKEDLYRFNRRVYESVSQKRAPDIVKQSREFADRYTYKQHDMGVFPTMAMLITYFKSMLPAMASKIKKYGEANTSTKWATDAVANSLTSLNDALFTTHLPFIQGVANVLEKGFELKPYGFVKGGVYGVGALAAKIKKDPEMAENLASKSGEMIIRATIGMLITSVFMQMADDDDDDSLPALYGGGGEDFKKQAAIKTVRPQNTIRMFGRNVNLDFLGSLGISLKAEAAILDLKRYSEQYNKLSDEDKYYAQVAAMAQTLMIGSYTQGVYDMISSAEKGGEKLLSKSAELITRIIIPFTAATRQAYQLANPTAKRPVNFKEQLAKYSGLVAGWSLKRPAFDFLGDNYETGDLYTGSPDAFLKMLGAMENSRDNSLAKKILKDVNYDIGFTKVKASDERYFIFDKETGKQRAMTTEEEYDVNYLLAKKFKKDVKDFYDKLEKQSESTKKFFKNPKNIKNEIAKIHNKAKYDAFFELYKEVPMFLEKEAELENLKSENEDLKNK